MAGSDNTLSRAEIMRNAAQLAAQKHCIEFSDFSYGGDGVWDVEAANNLGWNFIGIGAGKHADALRLAGAVKNNSALRTGDETSRTVKHRLAGEERVT
jgi:hypothetical protein